MSILLTEGKNTNIECRNCELDTPLLCALESKHIECAKFLVSNGANLGIADRDAMSPLMTTVKLIHPGKVNEPTSLLYRQW